MRKIILLAVAAVLLTACENPYYDEETEDGGGNVTLIFNTTGAATRTAHTPAQSGGSPSTRAAATAFTKLNVMLFNEDGTKYFDKVRTQTADDEDFCQMSLTLPVGEYTIVAVGHSSAKSATIKSPELVTFTASDGEKLTDTFCYTGTVTVGDTPTQHSLTMSRMVAMVRFCFTDDEIPAQLATMQFDYTGGSASLNPTTGQGTTKSKQSESRGVSANDEYRIFTFPYQSATGKLSVTLSAMTDDGSVIKRRTLTDVPVTRNRITTYTSPLFSEGEGTVTQSGFSFTVNGEWDGDDQHTF